MPGKGAFQRCVESVTARGGARSPGGVCATAGRKKYGAAKFQQMAAAGRRLTSKRKNIGPIDASLDQLLSLSPTGAALTAIEKQREKLQRRMRREQKNGLFGKKVTLHLKRTKKTGTRVKDTYGGRTVGFKRMKTNGKKKTRKNKVLTARPTVWSKGKGGRGNPRNPIPAAKERYASFHGRPSGELIKVVTPLHEHSVLAGIGLLRKLVVIAPNGYRVTINNFGVNAQDAPAILAMNEEATQLYIDGGDQSVNLADFGIGEPFHEKETLGKVRDVYYFTRKDHLGNDGGTATYHHKFGGLREVGGKRKRSALPDLIYDTRNKLLEFSGGGYTIPDEGIANGKRKTPAATASARRKSAWGKWRSRASAWASAKARCASIVWNAGARMRRKCASLQRAG